MTYGQGNTTTNVAKAGKGKLKTKNESKTLVEANANRVALIVCNLGTKTVSLCCGATAVSGEGITLQKESPPFVLTGYTGKVTAIASSEEPEISYTEL